MIIKGISRYDVTENKGKINVRNLKTGRVLKIRDTSTSPNYYVRIDSDTPEYKCFSPGFLRFLIKNPELDARTISPVNDQVRFTEDGSVIDLHESAGRKKPYNSFKDVDDALTTVIIMKAASSGDLNFVYNFIIKYRNDAIMKVAHLEDASLEKVRLHSADGEELFIRQLRTANCQRIIPLFAWLCKCIRVAYLENKRRFVQMSKFHSI